MSNLELTHQTLLKGLIDGDQKAFSGLYDLYWEKLFNYGYSKLGKKEVTEGFVQEIFIELWIKRETLVIHTSISSYLFTSIKHKVLNYQKAQMIREKFAAREKVNGVKSSNVVEEKVFHNDLQENVKKIIRNFPRQRKAVYKLRFNKEMSYREIAETMSISVSTVEKHLIKAVSQLRINLKEMGFRY